MGHGWGGRGRLGADAPHPCRRKADAHVLDVLVELLTMQPEWFSHAALFCFVFMIARNVARVPKVSWLQRLVLTFTAAFGGGTLVPLLLGKPPVWLLNDLLVTVTLLCWFLANYTPVGRLVDSTTVLRLPLNLMANVFRGNGCCNTTAMASKALPSSKWYPTPLFGPVFLGTLGSTGGNFLPFDKGLAALRNGLSMAFQPPLIGAILYHLIVNDAAGPIGSAIASVTGTLDALTVRLAIVGLFLFTCAYQDLVDPSFDIFQALGIKRLFGALSKVAGQGAPGSKPKKE